MHMERIHDWQTLRPGAFLILALLLALLAACGGQTTPPAGEQPAAADTAVADADAVEEEAETDVIRVGYLPVIIQAPLYVGIERGYFADEGLEFDLSTIRSGNDAVVQLAAGNFDVAMGGANAGLYNAIARGIDFKVVAPMHSESPPLATPLIISADRTDEIQSVADLEGGRVAVHAFGAAIEYWMSEALAQGGLTFDDVELESVLFPNMAAALSNGDIDAAVLTEPLVTINQDQGLVAILSDDYIEGFTATYVYMNEEWRAANPDLARKFMRAYLRACRDLQGDYMTEEMAGIIEQYTEVPAPIVMRSAPAQFDPDGTISVANLEALQEFFMERGHLEYDELLDINSFVDQSLANEVAQELDAETSN
jgi:NitT/TauT family transport system substrate-binding protein